MSLNNGMALALAFGLVVAGCGDDDVVADDGGSRADGGGGVVDGGGGDVDGGGDADGGDVDGGSIDLDVERCRASSATLAATCPSDGSRTCHAAAYADFCNADARPGLYADALDCLVAMSSDEGCRTFSDPSGAETCVDAVYATTTSTEIDAVGTRIGEFCKGSPMPERTEPPLFTLTPAQLAALQSCVDAAEDCGAMNTCIDTMSGSIAACY